MQREVKTRAWVLLLIFVTGCGDPTKDRLEVGQRVILVPTHADSSGKVSSESVLGRVPEGDTLLVPAGTEAKVARDDGPLDDPVRKVVLTITEGEFAGVLAEESRYALRPVK